MANILEGKELQEAAFAAVTIAPGDNYVERLEESHEDFLARMQAEGMQVVIPADNELFLDIDTEETYQHFLLAWSIIANQVQPDYDRLFIWGETKSKSGNRHIRIQLPFKLTNFERIAWQAALGSDRFRELYSCIRTLRKHPYPTLLAEKAENENV